MNKVYDKLIRQGGIEEALCAERMFEKYPAGCIFAHYSREINLRAGVYWYLYGKQPNRYTVAADTSETIFPLLSRRNFCPGARCHAEKNELYRQYESEKFEPLDNQTSMRLEWNRRSFITAIISNNSFFLLFEFVHLHEYILLKVSIASCSIIKSIAHKFNQTGIISSSAWTIYVMSAEI